MSKGGKRKSKPKSKAQKAAAARHAKFKQTRVQTFGGKRKSFSKSEETRIKKAGYKVDGYSQAAPNKASGYSGTTGVSVGSKIKNPNPKVSGVGPVISGSEYSKMLKANPPKLNQLGRNELSSVNQNIAGNYTSPNVTNYGLRPDGVTGEYKTGDVFNTGGISGKDYRFDGKRFVPFNETAMLPGDDNLGGPAAILGGVLTIGGMGVNAIKNMKENFAPKLRENLEKKLNPKDVSSTGIGNYSNLVAAADPTALSGLGIGAPKTTGFTPTIGGLAESLGLDPKTGKDVTTTAGGLNIGGGEESGSRSRVLTSEQLGDAYKSTLNPNSFKGLSDGETFGSGPVASGEDYARGLNVSPYGSVENTMRSVVGKIPLINRLPGVNTRLLTDKEIADKRISAQKKSAYRNEMAKFRGGASGGNRLPVTPTVIEEIIPEALPVPSASTTPTTQTGVDPNRLLQIQQQAYAQAYNPMLIGGFNPQFRFGAATPTIDYSTYFNY